MTSYTPDQFYQDWVYALDKDFRSSDGTPVQYASDQPKYWGEEYARIPLSSSPSSVSLNADGSLIAVALKHDIQIYATDSKMELQQILHISLIDTVRFHPRDPKALVSCASNEARSPRPNEPTIVFWNLDEQRHKLLWRRRSLMSSASMPCCL